MRGNCGADLLDTRLVQKHLFTVSSHMVTTCHEMDNFETKLQKYYPKEILSLSGMVPSEWNPVYICQPLNLRANQVVGGGVLSDENSPKSLNKGCKR